MGGDRARHKGRRRTYELRIALISLDPAPWRLIRLPSHLPLRVVGELIERSMGQESIHWFEFYKDDMSYVDHEMMEEENDRDMALVPLHDVLVEQGDWMDFENGPGRAWDHMVTLEAILDLSAGDSRPVCVDGEDAGPVIDDMIGPRDWAELLEAYEDEGHERHDEALELLGPGWDWEHFDPDEATRRMDRARWAEWAVFPVALPGSELHAVVFVDALSWSPVLFDVASPDRLDRAALALLDGAHGEPALTQPYRLIVGDPDLMEPLAGKSSDLLQVVGPVPPPDAAWEERIADWVSDVLESIRDVPPYLSAGDADPDLVAGFFRAAVRLHEAAPWERIPAHMPFAVRIEGVFEDPGALLAVLGRRDGRPGLLLADDVDDYLDLRGTGTTGLPIPRSKEESRRLLLLHFVRGADLPREVRREISEHSWEVSGAGAYPRIIDLSMDEPRAPAPHDLRDMTAAIHAVRDMAGKHTGRISDRLPLTHDVEVEFPPGAVHLRYPHPGLGSLISVLESGGPWTAEELDEKIENAIEFISAAMKKYEMDEDL